MAIGVGGGGRVACKSGRLVSAPLTQSTHFETRGEQLQLGLTIKVAWAKQSTDANCNMQTVTCVIAGTCSTEGAAAGCAGATDDAGLAAASKPVSANARRVAGCMQLRNELSCASVIAQKVWYGYRHATTHVHQGIMPELAFVEKRDSSVCASASSCGREHEPSTECQCMQKAAVSSTRLNDSGPACFACTATALKACPCRDYTYTCMLHKIVNRKGRACTCLSRINWMPRVTSRKDRSAAAPCSPAVRVLAPTVLPKSTSSCFSASVLSSSASKRLECKVAVCRRVCEKALQGTLVSIDLCQQHAAGPESFCNRVKWLSEVSCP